MTKIWKSTLNSIIVLASVAFISVIAVLLLNALLPPKSSFFNKQKLQNICAADDYQQLTENELAQIGVNLSLFNEPYSSATARSVFIAIGGKNDGNYIVEAEGVGYNDAYPIVLYVAYNNTGEIIGVTDLFVDKGNTFWGDIKPHLTTIYSDLIGKSGDVGSGIDLLNAKTGATQSLNGIARAVNIANALVRQLLDANGKAPYTVTDVELLEKLRQITNIGNTFTCYPFAIVEEIDGATTEVMEVYISSGGDIVFKTKSDAKTYGRTTLLTLIDAENKSVKKINPISMSAVDSDNRGVYSEFLNDMEVLTGIFMGLTIDDIDNMDKHLTGSTNATQTANGVKTAVKSALKNIKSFSEYIEEMQGGEHSV